MPPITFKRSGGNAPDYEHLQKLLVAEREHAIAKAKVDAESGSSTDIRTRILNEVKSNLNKASSNTESDKVSAAKAALSGLGIDPDLLDTLVIQAPKVDNIVEADNSISSILSKAKSSAAKNPSGEVTKLKLSKTGV